MYTETHSYIHAHPQTHTHTHTHPQSCTHREHIIILYVVSYIITHMHTFHVHTRNPHTHACVYVIITTSNMSIYTSI